VGACNACGDDGPGIYCTACGARRGRRVPSEAAKAQSSVKDADLSAYRAAAASIYRAALGEDLSPDQLLTDPAETLWLTARRIMQFRMVFDEELIADTPHSELLWEAFCRVHDIDRGAAGADKRTYSAAGPLGFTWWGGILPQTVELLTPGEEGARAHLRASVTLGKVRPAAEDQILSDIDEYFLGMPLSAFVVDGEGLAKLICSVPADADTIERASHLVVSMMSRQVALGAVLQAVAENRGHLELHEIPYPTSGRPEALDELVSILFEGSPWDPVVRAGVASASADGFAVPDVRSPLVEHNLEQYLGWSRRIYDDAVEGSDRLSIFFLPGTPESAFILQTHDNLYPAVSEWLRADPGATMQYRRFAPSYSSRGEALQAANRLLCKAWDEPGQHIIGRFEVLEGDSGRWEIVGVASCWSAPSLSSLGVQTPGEIAAGLFHAAEGLADQESMLAFELATQWKAERDQDQNTGQ
jgi:hypothetical protein